jgi:hypothetical protein
MYNLIGKRCSAVGTCGMTKDIEVVGTLLICTQNDAVIKNDKGVPCAVNPKTVKEIK